MNSNTINRNTWPTQGPICLINKSSQRALSTTQPLAQRNPSFSTAPTFENPDVTVFSFQNDNGDSSDFTRQVRQLQNFAKRNTGSSSDRMKFLDSPSGSGVKFGNPGAPQSQTGFETKLVSDDVLMRNLKSKGFDEFSANRLVFAMRLVEQNDPNPTKSKTTCQDLINIAVPAPSDLSPNTRARTRQIPLSGKPRVEINQESLKLGTSEEDSLVTTVATLANELYHLREISDRQNGGGTEIDSDKFMIQTLRNFQDKFMTGSSHQRIFDYDPAVQRRANKAVNHTIRDAKRARGQ